MANREGSNEKLQRCAAARPATADGKITKPAAHDVLLGRGKSFQNHPGNKRMLKIVRANKVRYLGAKRDQKRGIVEEVLGLIQEDGTRFLKMPGGADFWEEVDVEITFEKVSHALRSKKSPNPDAVKPATSSNKNDTKTPSSIQQHSATLATVAEGVHPQATNYPQPLLPFVSTTGVPQTAMIPSGILPLRGLSDPTILTTLVAQQLNNPDALISGATPQPAIDQLIVRTQVVDSLLREEQRKQQIRNALNGLYRFPPFGP